MNDPREKFMLRAVELARAGMDNNEGGPFGCVVVRNGEIVGEGNNRVTSTNDPTAHAEMVAIREACRNLQTFQLSGCEVYTSCEPCPMCLGALYWARPETVYFANTRSDAAAIGFDDSLIYDEIGLETGQRRLPMVAMPLREARAVFDAWKQKTDKTPY
jgi:guanine deaminase